MSRFVLGLLSVLMIVSFQNCGQSGVISLESQSGLAKLDGSQPQGDVIVDPDVVPSEEQLPVQPPVVVIDPVVPPKTPPKTPPVEGPNAGSPPDSATSQVPKSGMSGVGYLPGSPKDSVGTDVGSSLPGGSMPPASMVTDDEKDHEVSHGAIVHEDRDDDDIDLSKDDPDYDVDEDDGTITRGHQISCAGLNKLVMASSLFVKSSNVSSAANSSGALKIVNKDQVSISNHKGLLFLLDIKNIISLKNIRSMLLSASADSIGEVENVRALSMMSADNVSKISNFRGLLCLDAVNVSDISNFRGILEVSGNIKKISNFRGILKVKGNVGVLENFRGILKVDGDIASQSNVKVNLK